MTVVRGVCIDHGRTGNGKGYTSVYYKGSTVGLHRLVYCEYNQVALLDIKGDIIRHTCDNPRCINPEHLLVGTYQDNMRDRQERNRQAKGVMQGSAKLTEADVRYIRKVYTPRSREYGVRALARKFGMSFQPISAIVQGKAWTHVA